MTCPDHEHIERHIKGRLTGAESKALQAHVQDCPACAQRIEEARANELILAQLKTHTVGHDVLEAGSPRLDPDPWERIDNPDHAQRLLGERYRVIKKIDTGQVSDVFQAEDTVLERSVAIKFLRAPDLHDDQSQWTEARLMGRVSHPAIAQVYEIGHTEGRRFVVMEWIEGLPLTEAWRALPRQQRLALFLKVLEGVGAAHRQGIIHRDLKPSNILVTADSQPKVLDFGIAVKESSYIARRLYRGTPAYSAPEQIACPAQVSTSTDVYALGVLLYELLTDTLPFTQTDPRELFEAIQNKWPQLPRALCKDVPIALQNICLKALEKVPARRYARAQDMADDLQRFLRGERVWSRPSFLADTIQQELFLHRQQLGLWHDNGLITQQEYDRLDHIYDRIISPPDPSIIEARHLSLSQVCLYLGGWIVVVGSFILFYKTWSQVTPLWRPVPAIIATGLMSLLGIVLWRFKESRLAVGFMATATLLIPVTTAVTLAQWDLLGGDLYPWGDEAVYQALINSQSHVVVGNIQIFMAACAWLGCSLGLQRMTRSSIFVLFLVFASLALLTSIFIIAGMAQWPWHIIAGRYLITGGLLYGAGTLLDRAGQPRYAWPTATTGMLLCIASLTVLALSEQTLFGWLHLPLDGLDIQERHAMSLMGNGLVYLGWAGLCRRWNTGLQRSYAMILNWLGPLHLLTPLRILDIDVLDLDASRRVVYRFLLPIISLAFVFGSVSRQMKSFFFSGLGGIALAAHKITSEHLSRYFAWPVGLIVTGMLSMLASCILPRLKARQAMKRPSQNS